MHVHVHVHVHVHISLSFTVAYDRAARELNSAGSVPVSFMPDKSRYARPVNDDRLDGTASSPFVDVVASDRYLQRAHDSNACTEPCSARPQPVTFSPRQVCDSRQVRKRSQVGQQCHRESGVARHVEMPAKNAEKAIRWDKAAITVLWAAATGGPPLSSAFEQKTSCPRHRDVKPTVPVACAAAPSKTPMEPHQQCALK